MNTLISAIEKPNVVCLSPPGSPFTPKQDKRLYLRPEEANRLIAAAGKRGRHRFRDRVLVRMTYRHGLRAREVVLSECAGSKST